jgi:hypothetical protein
MSYFKTIPFFHTSSVVVSEREKGIGGSEEGCSREDIEMM